MKRIFCFLLICTLLSGCTPAQNNPILPSSKTPASSVRIVRTQDALYYDCGQDSAMPRCGNADSTITGSEDIFSIPTENETANFPGTFSIQHVGEDRIELLTDDAWRIFKKIDTNRDISQYTKAYTVSGKLPNAVESSTFLILASHTDFTFEQASKSLFSSNSNDFIDAYVLPIMPYYIWGITLSAENITPTGLTLTCKQSGGTATGTLQTGDSFNLQCFRNNRWENLETKTNPIFHSIARLIPQDSETKWDVRWEWLYGTLPPGQYRIAKTIQDFRDTGDFDSAWFYAEFEIK